VRGLQHWVSIAVFCCLAAVVYVTWDSNRDKADTRSPHANATCFPAFIGELVIVPDEAIKVKHSVSSIEFLCFVLVEVDKVIRIQRDLSSCLDQEFQRYDRVVFRRRPEIGTEAPAHRLNAKCTQFQWRPTYVFDNCTGTIIDIVAESGSRVSRQRFELEIIPEENGGFCCNQNAELIERGFSNFRCRVGLLRALPAPVLR
jgi:hypothetical protein